MVSPANAKEKLILMETRDLFTMQKARQSEKGVEVVDTNVDTLELHILPDKVMRCSKPPQLGPIAGDAVQGETTTLVGPMTPRIITDQKQQIKYPDYRIRDTHSLKDR